MPSSLINYSFLDLVLGTQWSQKEKDAFFEKYHIAYTNHLTKTLETKIKNPSLYSKLLKEGDENKIVKFLEKEFPDFTETSILVELEFRKAFILNLYKQMIQQSQREADKAAWKKILQEAESDNWQGVLLLLEIFK